METVRHVIISILARPSPASLGGFPSDLLLKVQGWWRIWVLIVLKILFRRATFNRGVIASSRLDCVGWQQTTNLNIPLQIFPPKLDWDNIAFSILSVVSKRLLYVLINIIYSLTLFPSNPVLIKAANEWLETDMRRPLDYSLSKLGLNLIFYLLTSSSLSFNPVETELLLCKMFPVTFEW